jgi:hypothetical protein
MHSSLPHPDATHDWAYTYPNDRISPTPYKLKDIPLAVMWNGWWHYKHGDPLIGGISIAVHKRVNDAGVFVGARQHEDEVRFPPRFFPSFEVALVWIKLVATFP